MNVKSGGPVLFAIMCVACTQLLPNNADSKVSPQDDNASDLPKVAPLMSAIKAKRESIWVEYHTSCSSDVSERIPLDLVIHGDTIHEKSDTLSAVQDRFREDKGISVSELRPGIIEIKSDGVWSQVFQAKPVNLKLAKIDRYNPEAAIWDAIEASKGSLPALHVRLGKVKSDDLLEEPSRNRPHLKASAKYKTVEDLLDDVSRTFGGILVYKECTRSDGTHLFDINYYRKDNFDEFGI